MVDSRPFIIGLTGGIASGKSTISKLMGQRMKSNRAEILDADSFGWKAYDP